MIPGNHGFEGQTPQLTHGTGNPEAQKYGRLWATEEYRKYSPGEVHAARFLQIARPRVGATVIDFGCGSGRGGLHLALPPPVGGNLKVVLLDFVRNCLDPDIQDMLTTQAHALQFVKADLEQPIPVRGEYGFCCDVMEHIPPDKVDRVLDNILFAAQHVFFSISTTKDKMGELIDEELHLTVQPYSWWLDQFAKRKCVIHWTENHERGGAVFFYVTAWATGQEIQDSGVLNTEQEQIRTNVRHNVAQGWTQVQPYQPNDFEVAILGGGPSLSQFEDQIRAQKAAGVQMVTLNGAYNWAIEKGLHETPGALNQFVVDARPFNARFTKPVLDTARYFISSQCDPSVFEGLPRDRTWIWHTSYELIKDILDEQYGPGGYVPGMGGSTVLLRAIPLLRMLGFRRFHLYGCDSCVTKEAHHAYPQPENATAPLITVTAGGTLFQCQGWMVSQAHEFQDLIRSLSDEIELEIYGDGLLAHILQTGFTLQLEADAQVSEQHAVVRQWLMANIPDAGEREKLLARLEGNTVE